jgi:hypothetical protein
MKNKRNALCVAKGLKAWFHIIVAAVEVENTQAFIFTRNLLLQMKELFIAASSGFKHIIPKEKTSGLYLSVMLKKRLRMSIANFVYMQNTTIDMGNGIGLNQTVEE